MKQIIFAIRWPVTGIRNYLKYTFNDDLFNGYRFTIVAPDLEFSGFVNRHLKSDRFDFVPCGVEAKSMAIALIRVCREHSDAHIHAHGFTALAYAILPAIICRRKLFATAHDLFTPNQFDGRYGSLKRLVMTFALNRTQATIAVSEDCKQNILRYLPKVTAKKLHAVLNGINSSYFAHAEPRPLKAELELADETLLVGFLGRFMSQKGFKYVIEAVRLLDKQGKAKGLKLVCFGWGGFIREEQKKIAKLGLGVYFLFLPYSDDVAPVIKGLDVVVMPSLWEACGILAMEVLACGTPLIASNCEGLREVIRDTPTTVVPLGSSEELAQALEIYLKKDLRKYFVEYAKIAQDRFCASNTSSRQTIKVYQLKEE